MGRGLAGAAAAIQVFLFAADALGKTAQCAGLTPQYSASFKNCEMRRVARSIQNGRTITKITMPIMRIVGTSLIMR